MKKLILLMTIIVGMAISVKAQTAMINPNGLTLDTATQAAAKGCTLKVPGYQKTISIIIPATKISGTIVGKIDWQGSNDGTNYYTIKTDTLVNATNVYGYKEVDKAFLYYKANITQTGTSSLSFKGITYFLKPNGQ